MRVLICTQAVDRNDPVLGFFHRWLEEFARHCESIVVICLRKGDVDLQKNVEVISLGTEGKILRAIELSTIAWGRRREYDAVFVHMNPEYIAATGWLWRVLGKRVVLWYAHKSANKILRIALRFTDAILTATTSTFPLQDVRVRPLGQGIDTDSFAPRAKTSHPPRFVTIGRIAPTKRLLEMVEGIAPFISQASSAELLLYGNATTDEEKTYAKDLLARINQLTLGDRIRLQGSVSNSEVPHVLEGATGFITFGITGGMDKAVLEAMACGVPVIGANPVFDDVLKECGTYVERPDSLPEALEAFMSKDAMHQQAIGTRMRDFVVKEHGLKQFAQKVINELGVPSGI